MQPSQDRKSNKRLITILVCGVFFMFVFCYLLVPFYDFICKKEGINGRGVRSATLKAKNMQVDKSRMIKVDFTTTLHGALGFKFVALHRQIEMHPGETKLVYFFAENTSGHDMTVQAVPSITPMDAAKFLKKTQCFCFTQQFFFKGQKADMPVYFFIEPDLPQDIKEITLSYTLFDVAGFEKKNGVNIQSPQQGFLGSG